MQKTPLHLLKIGGKLIEDQEKLTFVLDRFSKLEGAKVLVHGGGKRANQLCTQLSIEPKMVDGRRITDAPTLEVVTMVYSGLINKNIVSQLQALGCNAIGLSGADGNTILAHKRVVKTIDYGFAGDIDEVNSSTIAGLISLGLIPVFCAITHDGKGQLLNTNADTIAATLATALAGEYEVHLKYCFEKQGVLSEPANERSVIKRLDPHRYQAYRQNGVINEGMIPKLDNAFGALSRGVEEVIIGNPKTIFDGTGTVLKI